MLQNSDPFIFIRYADEDESGDSIERIVIWATDQIELVKVSVRLLRVHTALSVKPA